MNSPMIGISWRGADSLDLVEVTRDQVTRDQVTRDQVTRDQVTR
jgi:hypothetical protein